MDKRGQGLSTSTIILLILGLIILVVLILGFTMGWDKLGPILGLGEGKNNVDQIAQVCDLACSTKSTYDFCSRQRQIEIDSDKIPGTCSDFSDSNDADYKAEYAEYGIARCIDITCPA